MSESLLVRALGKIAPRAAARRLYGEVALEQARAYAGAALGRHTDGWKTVSSSADAEIALAGNRLRDRSRDLTRNNPHAAKALSSWVANIVGDGIMPRIRDPKLKALWQKFERECDADGQLNWYAMQTLAAREMIESGEVLARRRRRRSTDALAVPLQVQLLESDFIDSSKSGDTLGGNLAINGVEFNGIGQRVAYWLFAQHPGNSFASFLTRANSAPIPAADIAHVYEKQRTQTRGVPWCSPIIRAARDLDDYEFAEGVRKKIASSVVGVVTGFDDNEAERGVAPQVVDANGKVIEKFSPGMFAYARGGKQITFNTPGADGGYADYKKMSLKTIAAGYRLPYELLSGDLSDVNYSSIRAGLVEFRRLVTAMQWQVFIPGFCQKVWDWFTEAAFLAGHIPNPVVEVEWSAPKFEWVDPYKDVLADILAIRAGIRTWPEVVGETGRDPEQVLAEIIEWFGKFDAGNVVLDIDPRNTAKSGAVQQDPNAQPFGEAPPTKTKPARSDDPETSLLEQALALSLTRGDFARNDALERSLPDLIDAIRAQRPPIVRNQVNIPPVPAPPVKKPERTVVTKRDERGLVAEFERHEVD